MLPSFVGAGTGVAVTTGTSTISKTGCTAGNLIVLHSMVAGVSDDGSRSNIVNIESFDGTPTNFDHTGWHNVGDGPDGLHLVSLGRATANGTCSVDWTTGGSGEDGVFRLYEFADEGPGTTIETVIENGGATHDFAQTTDNNPHMIDCSTNGTNRLACTFVAIQGGSETVASATGETGGDWVEAVAEFANAVGTLSLQIANMPVAGGISGGGFTISTPRPWGAQGLAIIGTADGGGGGGASQAARMMTMGVG